jgi:NAD(P)H-hydrate epimerase
LFWKKADEMRVVSTREMQRIDRLAQEEYGMPGVVLMERAALAVRQAMAGRYGALRGRRIHIYCGKGNNGGDGLALARLLAEDGAEVAALLTFAPEECRGLARENLERCRTYGIPVQSWADLEPRQAGAADIIVDALLGTGAAGPLQGSIADAVGRILELDRPVVAVDAPTGVDMDSGRVAGPAIRADLTVTFGLPKPGLLIFPGADYVGELITAAIGFPRPLLEEDPRTVWATPSVVRPWLPLRPADSHKGSTGHVLICGGSAGMTGAVAIASLAALRGGAGLVTAALRPGMPFAEKPLEVMATEWPALSGRLEAYRAIVAGPGMGTAPDGRELLAGLLRESGAPLVLDADALNLLAAEPALLRGHPASLILTPHPGEMARLTGLSVAAVQADRLETARRYAAECNAVVVLKGARTITALPTGESYINSTGNPGMATAGMGDALSGLIAALLAQGLVPWRAAAAAVFLHGLAGDNAAGRLGPAGILASDVIGEFPVALKAL